MQINSQARAVGSRANFKARGRGSRPIPVELGDRSLHPELGELNAPPIAARIARRLVKLRKNGWKIAHLI
jgi:hypothetical protein